MKAKKRAYVSVYNKSGIVEFCRYLVEYGYELVATEGTCQVLNEAGIPALSAHELTGFPEPLGGKVRAVHPSIYTGIIANELTEEQLGELDEREVFPIELVVVNLYPFQEDIEAGIPFAECASHIDAGGVALITAAAKNFLNTVVVCDPADYERVLCCLAAGAIPEDERKYLMYKAFSYAASYNALVSQYLSRKLSIAFPQTLTVTYEKAQDMRYGENPHQRAALYREPILKEGSIARAKQLMGGALSYNNINDANSALQLVKEFEKPVVVVCKHCAPCSVGTGDSVFEAFINAAEGDANRLDQSVVAVNGIVDARTAEKIVLYRLEVAIAVGFTAEALTVFHFSDRKPILLEMPDIRSKVQFSTFYMHKIYGGLLVQTYDVPVLDKARCETEKKPSAYDIKAMGLAYKVAKHAHSSAVVIGGDGYTVAVGSGFPNRTEALKAALAMAGERAKGKCLASDSVLPGIECLEMIKNAGISSVIQSGGYLDDEMIEKCNELGLVMFFTDERHLRS